MIALFHGLENVQCAFPNNIMLALRKLSINPYKDTLFFHNLQVENHLCYDITVMLPLLDYRTKRENPKAWKMFSVLTFLSVCHQEWVSCWRRVQGTWCWTAARMLGLVKTFNISLRWTGEEDDLLHWDVEMDRWGRWFITLRCQDGQVRKIEMSVEW